jgi:hypothetical protein
MTVYSGVARVAGIACLFVCVYLSLILILDLTRKPRTGTGLYQRRPLPHLAMFICVYFDLIGLWQHERRTRKMIGKETFRATLNTCYYRCLNPSPSTIALHQPNAVHAILA